MSAAFKPRIVTSSATQELWSVAETGDVEELERVLQRVGDINARNKHGMTALMRAASQGHQQMVRELLARGADPNVMRNDRFTALALAAFFGHTEIVRNLIEHGAKTEIVTRCGASAQTWAIVRTFKDAARCLESHTPKPAPAPARAPAPAPAPAPARAPAPAPAPVPAPVPAPAPVIAPAPVQLRAAPAPTPAPVVKTLKDPPEIWDLVHEEPRGFNPRSAFFSRLGLMNRPVAVGVLAGLLLIVAGGVGVVMFRGSHANTVKAEVEVKQDTNAPAVPVVPVDTAPSASVEEPKVSEVEAPPSAHVVTEQPRRATSRPFKARYAPDNQIIVQESTPEVEPPTVATPQFEKPKPIEAPRARPAEGVSPQVITPAQTTKPKAKVIQWP